MDSIEERIERAARRWARATISSRRFHELHQASLWRINASRLVLDYPGLACIRGGGDPPDSVVRDRIRQLIRTGALSPKPPVKMFAGPCERSHSCSLCGDDIATGKVEFEAVLPDRTVMVFHRHCVDLWFLEGQSETA